MSGSGGGSFGGQFGQDDFEVTCEKLTIDTQLSSPDPQVVAQLSVGVIMGIMQINSKGTLLTVAIHNGMQAGGIASPYIQRLRDCMTNGTTYVAKVTAINGGQVRVSVYAI
ncbi:TPA: hypothetical protein ACNP34_002003 [Citrobacter freundii]|uniref:hypothetical protein n=1 Tax=Enterobacterales TaxID=91347 RepID=UPI0015E9EAE6|nr:MULTISPECIES: hypothetical protein [Enterobacterales]MDA5495738.1 hypothetical protein [Yersinia intermedia]QLR54485.1 hypothetical protein HV344_21305 [Citrobacter freundii]HBU6114162.1 hypothetical protein [Citrobacter freundii]HEE0043234.1 hypothetical protein [Citrobacter freundii]HEE9926214.1 hypothetical protein [Citrobacter freundii]